MSEIKGVKIVGWFNWLKKPFLSRTTTYEKNNKKNDFSSI